MSTNARATIDEVRRKNEAFYRDPRGRGALRDLQQTFPHPWLYLAELLQNSVDEGAKTIHIVANELGDVEFQHDGRPFTERDVEAIYVRGVSPKGVTAVGFMGIGFKAVFRSFENVAVSSGPWRFRFAVPVRTGDRYGDRQRDWLGAVMPVWDDAGTPPLNGMTCRFVLSKRLAGLQSAKDDFAQVCAPDYALFALLARRGVRSLVWNGERWSLSQKSRGKREGVRQFHLQARCEAPAATKRWILLSAEYRPSDTAVARFLEHRQPDPQQHAAAHAEAARRRSVDVFAELDAKNIPLTSERGHIFALLPTGRSAPIGLHIHADWLLTTTRQELMSSDANPWHDEILDQIPLLTRAFLHWLVSDDGPSDNGWQRGYNVLPSTAAPSDTFDEWFLGDRLQDALRVQLRNLKFLPAVNDEERVEKFVSPHSARLLPEPLKLLGRSEAHPRKLFGNRVVDRTVLGERAVACLRRLQLGACRSSP